MKGKLWGIGIGPGDSELLTLKAVRLISQCDILAVPQSGEDKTTALDIVKGAVNVDDKEKLVLEFLMLKDKEAIKVAHEKNAQNIVELLEEGKNVVFITLGDVSIFSTFSYIQEYVENKGFEVELCPGVPSFCAVAAKVKTSLTTMKDPLLIVPAIHSDINEYLDFKGTKVFMKAGKSIGDIKKAVEEKGVFAIGAMNCGMPNEHIFTSFENVEENYGYFTTIIVKEKE